MENQSRADRASEMCECHRVDEGGRGYRRKHVAYDHWHRTEKDKGRPYNFTTAVQLLDDFWKGVRRALDEKGIQHDL